MTGWYFLSVIKRRILNKSIFSIIVEAYRSVFFPHRPLRHQDGQEYRRGLGFESRGVALAGVFAVLWLRTAAFLAFLWGHVDSRQVGSHCRPLYDGVRVCACVRACARARARVCVCVCMRACVRAFVRVFACVWWGTCVCLCVCVFSEGGEIRQRVAGSWLYDKVNIWKKLGDIYVYWEGEGVSVRSPTLKHVLII